MELFCSHSIIAIVSSVRHVTLIILFDVNHLFSQMEVVTGIVINTKYSIQHYSFIYTRSNRSKYCYVIPIIQFRHTFKEFQVFLCITNNSVQQSFIYSQLNDQTVLFDP